MTNEQSVNAENVGTMVHALCYIEESPEIIWKHILFFHQNVAENLKLI